MTFHLSTGPAQPAPGGAPRLSPRKRRLRWTIAALATLLAMGTVVGVALYRRARLAPYRPDEPSADITSELARGLPPAAPRPKLVDVTHKAGLEDFRNFAGQRSSQLPEDMGPGLAWGDFNNDGADDLFLVSAGGPLNTPTNELAPCRLFENLADGTFREVTNVSSLHIHGMGAAWGDYDGDGYLDLAVSGYNTLLLLHNEYGTGQFTLDPRLPCPAGFWSGVAWGDYDHDRRLDLYVCNYVQYHEDETDRSQLSDQIGTAVPYTLNPSSYRPGLNALFHQNPDGSFSDVAAELRVQDPNGRSLGAVWHDFDNDGWMDLYVANDLSDNVFFHNLGGRFEDISHPAWVADYRSAMGLAVGDFDRDGDDDLFISHWVAQENALYENLWANLNSASPNSVTPASGASKTYPLRFVDIADQKGLGQIALPMVGWGTEFMDLDQDGWLDLLVANGSTLEADGPPPKKLQPQETFLFWNHQAEGFYNLAGLHPGLSEKHVSRGLAAADFDNDGDLDFAIADLGEGVRLYRNDMAAGHWLKARLRSKNAAGVANGFGDGSTVIAWVNGVPLRRSVSSVSYLSQSSHTLHWGLGPTLRVDRLEVRWQAGGTNYFNHLEADATYEFTEGEAEPRKLSSVREPGRRPLSTREAPAPATSPEKRSMEEKQRLVKFWETERAAMNALKVEHDHGRAAALFREAIALNPAHEDSRYYLGLCLASQGDVDGALAALADLQKLNPQSHRAWQQWGVLRAIFARSGADLAAAEQALQRAHGLNPEETGALLVLGEVALLRGDRPLADERLAAATRTNPKAVGGFFLRGYVAWKRGDAPAARRFLELARGALGPDWQPKGATSEGDVKRRQHLETSPLADCWLHWNGALDPATAFPDLDRRLSRIGKDQPAPATHEGRQP